jgi:hypothetical protein
LLVQQGIHLRVVESCLILQGFMHMTRSGGLREWFKGNGTNCIRIVPNSAVKFCTYQELTRCATIHVDVQLKYLANMKQWLCLSG